MGKVRTTSGRMAFGPTVKRYLWSKGTLVEAEGRHRRICQRRLGIDWSELEDYKSVPFACAGSRKVRITGVSQLEPMPYSLDEIDLDCDLD